MIIKTAIFQGSSTSVTQKPKLRAPEYAFIGRSNVGKSSLINMLCGRKDLQATLKAMIEDYVSHSEELARLFILLDSRHELQEIDRNFITAVSGAGIPFTVILTKCDKLSKSALDRSLDYMIRTIGTIQPDVTVIPASSEKRIGKEAILDVIDADLKGAAAETTEDKR